MLMNRKMNFRRSHRGTVAAQIQTLESRALLAGDVLVSLKSGVLRITGDDEANNITIDVNGDGLSITGNNDTTINGEEDPFERDSLTGIKSIVIKMGDENDTVVVNIDENLTISKDVTVDMGDGDDALDVNVGEDGALNVKGAVKARLGDGDDAATVGGDGDVDDLNIGKDFSLFGDAGNDAVSLSDATVKGHAGLRGDLVAAENIDARKNFNINTDEENEDDGDDDQVAIADVSVGGKTRIYTFGGEDTVSIEGSITVKNTVSVNLGDGDDQLDVATEDITIVGNKKVTLHGGDGEDLGTEDIEDLSDNIQVKGFEETGPDVADLETVQGLIQEAIDTLLDV